MKRREFLHHAGLLQDFLVDSIEEFITDSGLSFDRAVFLRETSTNFAQVSVEALFFGADCYDDDLPDYFDNSGAAAA